MAGSEIVNYGDTICVVGGFDEATKLPRKTVSCWNPLQIGADNNSEDDAGDDDEDDDVRNATSTKGMIGLLVVFHISKLLSTCVCVEPDSTNNKNT